MKLKFVVINEKFGGQKQFPRYKKLFIVWVKVWTGWYFQIVIINYVGS